MNQDSTGEQAFFRAATDGGAPTVQAGPIPAKPSSWPTVIGIISIIIGSLGTANNCLCAPFGMAMSGVFKSMFDEMAQSQPAGTAMPTPFAYMDVMDQYLGANLILWLTSAGLSLTLLIGGIGMLRRRGWSSRTLNLWAIVKMVQAVPVVIVGYLMSRDMFAAMQESIPSGTGPGQMPAGMFTLMESFGLIAIPFQLLFYWAFPAFMLIWLRLRFVRTETAEWRGRLPSIPREDEGAP